MVEPTSCAARASRIEAALRAVPRGSPDALVGVATAACPPSYVALSGDHTTADPRRPFRMASVTKTFVATLVLREVERGSLTLDGPLGEKLPRLAYLRSTTVRDLLRHTSGLFPYEEDPEFRAWQRRPPEPKAPEELLARALAHTPEARTGAPFRYANTNYVALGQVLEALRKEPLDALVARELLGPEGLHETHAERPDEPLSPGFFPGFDAHGEPRERAHHPSWLYAAGNLVTTLPDLVAWTRRYGKGAVVPSALTKEWLTTVPTEPDVAYGLGVFVSRGEASGGLGEARSHAGDVAGTHLQAVHFVEADVTVVAVVNQDGGDPEGLVLAAARAATAKEREPHK